MLGVCRCTQSTQLGRAVTDMDAVSASPLAEQRLAMDRFLRWSTVLGGVLWLAACNSEPIQCPVLNDRYVLSYRSISNPDCAIGPYEIAVAGGAGVVTTTDTRPDTVIQTDVHLRGCTLSLKIEVTNAMTDATMSVAKGNLTVYDEDTISGVGSATKYLDNGESCQGPFELTLHRVQPVLPTAGMSN